jgi:Domain of unknown function (DUF4926)
MNEVCNGEALQNYQEGVLLLDIPEDSLLAGDVGTIIERHDIPDRKPDYSVEFFRCAEKYGRRGDIARERVTRTHVC